MTRPEIQPHDEDTAADSLQGLRARIDELDTQIARLLQERAAVSLRVGQTKSGSESAPIFVPHREAEVLANVQGVPGPLDGQAVEAQPGDTIAAALLRARVTTFTRSIKYHRPRGPFWGNLTEASLLQHR